MTCGPEETMKDECGIRNIGEPNSSFLLQYARSSFAFLIILLLITPMPACRRGGESDTLVIAIEAPPRGFDPRFSSTIGISARIMQLIYDTLVVKDENFEFVPSLAESFDESPDHMTFTFRLRAGVTFHDGRPLTSTDVKYTFDSMLSPALKSPIRSALDKISSIETPDSATVIFRAREPFYTFVGNLPAIGIIPDGAGTEIIDSPIGSGPYRFVSYREGEAVKLEANPNYWGGAPATARIHIKVVTDNSTRQAELMGGEVDLAYNAQFDPETVRALNRRDDIKVEIGDGANFDYLGLNLDSRSLTSNQSIRKAIAYAIDREVIIHRLLRDQARRAEAILPPRHWAYGNDITVYNHDIERAKQLLDEAGFADPDGDGPQPRFTLTILTSTNQVSRNIASILQDQLRRAGIQLDLRSFEFATLLDSIGKGQFDLYYLRGIGFNQITDVFQFVYHSRYQDSEFLNTITKLRSVTDPAEMKPLFDTLASVLARRKYCPNAQVERLIRQAAEANTNWQARKQLYLEIAKLLTGRGGQNRMRYCNPQVDSWIVEAESQQSRDLKKELYSKIQKTISDELPQIYLWYPSNVLIARARVGNIKIEPSGSWYFITKLTLEDQ